MKDKHQPGHSPKTLLPTAKGNLLASLLAAQDRTSPWTLRWGGPLDPRQTQSMAQFDAQDRDAPWHACYDTPLDQERAELGLDKGRTIC